MMPPIAAFLAAAFSGAAWRRWFGHAGFRRSAKFAAGLALGAVVARLAGLDLYSALCVAAMLAAGWTPGHVFDPARGLFLRYGAVTGAVGVGLVLLGHGWAWAYAPLGLFAPVGYVAAKAVLPRGRCWSCWGEAWLGALVYGGLPLAALAA